MELDREEWDLSNAEQLSRRGSRQAGGPNDNAGSTVSMMWVLGVIRHEASDGF